MKLPPTDSIKGRALKVILIFSIFLAVGLLYAALCRMIGFGIPCVFHSLTGYYCPGCGVSRMFLSLLRFDISGAWKCNPAVLSMLPLGCVIAIDMIACYIKKGEKHPRKWVSVSFCIMIIVLILFGVCRNI